MRMPEEPQRTIPPKRWRSKISSTLRLLYLHKNLPLPWAIKLTKKNPLPPPQQQSPVLHKNHLASPHHQSLSMGIRITLAMPVRPRVRHQSIEYALEIRSHIRVRMLIDRHARSSMRHIHITNAASHPGLLHNPLHRRSNIHELRPPPRLHPQSLHRLFSRALKSSIHISA